MDLKKKEKKYLNKCFHRMFSPYLCHPEKGKGV